MRVRRAAGPRLQTTPGSLLAGTPAGEGRATPARTAARQVRLARTVADGTQLVTAAAALRVAVAGRPVLAGRLAPAVLVGQAVPEAAGRVALAVRQVAPGFPALVAGVRPAALRLQVLTDADRVANAVERAVADRVAAAAEQVVPVPAIDTRNRRSGARVRPPARARETRRAAKHEACSASPAPRAARAGR